MWELEDWKERVMKWVLVEGIYIEREKEGQVRLGRCCLRVRVRVVFLEGSRAG